MPLSRHFRAARALACPRERPCGGPSTRLVAGRMAGRLARWLVGVRLAGTLLAHVLLAGLLMANMLLAGLLLTAVLPAGWRGSDVLASERAPSPSRLSTVAATVFTAAPAARGLSDSSWQLRLRYQRETRADTNAYHTLQRVEDWKPSETAIIVCDVWDYHHCRRAVDRLEQFGPRLNQVLSRARDAGATIIHSPSDCMPAYADHPARRRAQLSPVAPTAPPDVALWCSRIPAEERAAYPIDQSDGGEDDEPAQHAAWAAKLAALGRDPNLPWKRQSAMITIDAERDFVSDRGDEVWNVLESRGIRNVILTGVHTNMCVLGRPFGLRQMVRGGKNVVLMRDMTDCMYNPARWPYVSHYAGNDLVIGHVERFVCPTITSDQLLGGQPFSFADDRRPRLAVLVAEDGYGADGLLAGFARDQWLSRFRVTFIHGDVTDRTNLPGLEALDDADLAVVYARRRALRPEQLDRIRRFLLAGKPVVGLRTASHAFALRDGAAPAGTAVWPDFDVEVFGGRYLDHPPGDATARLELTPAAADHPITRGGPLPAMKRPGTLYRFERLAQGATPLWVGTHTGQPSEPVAWVFNRADGGRSFYTSLGERIDFADPAFVRLLKRAVEWAAGLEPEDAQPLRSQLANYTQHWTPVAVPASFATATGGVLTGDQGPAWFRAAIRTPTTAAAFPVILDVPFAPAGVEAWMNGKPLAAAGTRLVGGSFTIAAADVALGDTNLLVIRWPHSKASEGPTKAPKLRVVSATDNGQSDKAPPLSQPELAGRWQLRIGDDPSWANMPLPAKFGAPTDIVFEPWRHR